MPFTDYMLEALEALEAEKYANDCAHQQDYLGQFLDPAFDLWITGMARDGVPSVGIGRGGRRPGAE